MSLGIGSGSSILMHSSYKSLGKLEEGAKGFYEILMELIGVNGNLVVPTLSYDCVLNRPKVEFNSKNTPSCVGYLTEYFRTEISDTRRSLHATHSCTIWGKDKDILTAGHEKDCTPVGENSPFSKFPQLGGKILFLGSHPDHNTSMHGVEETIEEKPFIDFTIKTDYILYDEYGKKIIVPSYKHRFERDNGIYEQRYGRILSVLDSNDYQEGMILDAHCYLVDARALWKTGHRIVEKDPYYFVEFQEK